jgi:hypothetical protein
VIKLPGISDNQARGFKYVRCFQYDTAYISEISEIWHEVKRQVEEQGLKIGVYLDLPPIKI